MQTRYRQEYAKRITAYETDLEIAHLASEYLESGLLEILEKDIQDRKKDIRYRYINIKNTITHLHLRSSSANHFRKTIYSSFIKEIYEEVMLYLQGVSKSCAMRGVNPHKFLGNKSIEIDASELLAQGSWDNVVKLVTKEVFRDLERSDRTYKNLMKMLDKRLGLNLDQMIVDDAQPFFEIRHLLVHSDGIADHSFTLRFPNIKVDQNTREIMLTFRLVANATSKLNRLVKEIDKKLSLRIYA